VQKPANSLEFAGFLLSVSNARFDRCQIVVRIVCRHNAGLTAPAFGLAFPCSIRITGACYAY
jgi:hypothetical protein